MDIIKLRKRVNDLILLYLEDIRCSENQMLELLKTDSWAGKSDISSEARDREDNILRVKELKWVVELIDKR